MQNLFDIRWDEEGVSRRAMQRAQIWDTIFLFDFSLYLLIVLGIGRCNRIMLRDLKSMIGEGFWLFVYLYQLCNFISAHATEGCLKYLKEITKQSAFSQ